MPQEDWAKGVMLLEYAMKACEKQRCCARYFLFEQPEERKVGRMQRCAR